MPIETVNGARLRRWSTPLFIAVLFACLAPGIAQAEPLYPDLSTLPPRDLRFDRSDVSFDGSGQFHNVLRFTNTVWNGGPGKLETRGQIDPATRTGPAFQRVFDTNGTFTEYAVGGFYWHAQNHQHYHYDDWGRYELWDRPDFDAWIASGRTQGQADLRGTKTTSCVMDEEFIKTLPTTPFPAAYPSGGCLPNSQNVLVQGLSVGWGDTYDYYRDEQWIDLDQGSLANGQYVIRSITDPNNKVYESPGKADTAKESQVANEGIVYFTVQNGQVVDTTAPTGTVTINDVNASTTSKNVTLKVTGRDDVSGVDQVRVSADGVNWRTHNYTSSGSTPTSILCDLTDPAIGGSATSGTRTIYTQFKDRSGKWGQSESDSIAYEPASAPSSPYAQAVLADAPGGYWRLGETSGTAAADSAGAATGTFVNAPTLGSASLLSADTANRATRFDGTNDFVRVPHASAIAPTQRVTVETWINPEALPAAGSFASIATKREAYSLQFNGPRLEFTIMQNGTRRRTQAPQGAVVAGQTYHVVGTYDGTTTRLYLNGTQVATTALTGAIGPASAELAIGSWEGSSEFMRGTIDDVAVYGSALSAARVTAHYAAGTASTPPPDPTVAAPSGLSAIAASQTQVELRWTDNATNESEFVIERDTNSSFSSPQAMPIGENSTAYSVTGLTAGTQYYFRVKARNVTQTSAWSNVATATTPSPPPPPTSAYGQMVLTDDPVSYWRLGDSGTSALDQRAINPGVFVNGAVQGATSLLAGDTANKAVTLDGVNDHVSVLSSSSLNIAAPLTLEAWIKPTAVPAAGSFASIVTKPDSYSLQLAGSQLELTIMQFGVRQRLLAPAGTIVAGQTYHVVASYDGSTRRLFVNGSEVANAPLTGGATASSNAVAIGSWDGAKEFFAGSVDDVAIYDGALAAGRVAAHYTEGAGTPPLPPPAAGYAQTVLADIPISHWRLGEASGTAAADVRGVNAGTYVNAPTLGVTSLLVSDTANKAVTFDGSNDHVSVANSNSLRIASPLTLEAWIKPTSLPANGSYASVMTKRESYSLQFNGSRIELTIMQNGTRRRTQAPAGSIVAGQTYHLVGTYDGTTTRLYINGAQVATTALTGGATLNANPLFIGSWDGSSEFFRGVIDEPAVYAGALSAARVAAHYDAGR
jgi:hypothetical protein